MTAVEPKGRFTDRVENYVRYRPDYPEGVLDVLCDETGLTPAGVIADIGSGTGISSELFLRNGNTVYGVEPNAEMRQAAERLLERYAEFRSVAAAAEATGLPGGSVDYVVVGQAFHWFDAPKAKDEFARILRTDGWVVLMWNARRLEATPFLRAYEALLHRFGTDYAEVQWRTVDPDQVRAVFADWKVTVHRLYNEQLFDFEGLKGRLLSSSYTPAPSHPDYRAMLNELERIFKEYADADTVRLEYDTEIYVGRMG